MSRIFITGDTHGGWRGFEGEMARFKRFEKFEKSLCKDDYLIVAGDFGFVWNMFQSNATEERWLKYFAERKFTTLFIDGNHENFDRLNAYEVSEFKGGKVHKISESVYHLMRGQIYEIDGRKIFTLGGAMSVDKSRREPDISWWAGEAITQDDFNEAWRNLTKCDFIVDIVISHTCPRKLCKKFIRLNNYGKIKDINMDILQGICNNIEGTSLALWYNNAYGKTK